MARERTTRAHELSRREFLETAGGALAGMAAFGLVDRAAAGERHPQRGGSLQYGSKLLNVTFDPDIPEELASYGETSNARAAIWPILPSG